MRSGRKAIAEAEAYRLKMEAAVAPLNTELRRVLEDYNACVLHQPGDGWVVLFADDHNAGVRSIDFDALLKMDKRDALNYLMLRSI